MSGKSWILLAPQYLQLRTTFMTSRKIKNRISSKTADMQMVGWIWRAATWRHSSMSMSSSLQLHHFSIPTKMLLIFSQLRPLEAHVASHPFLKALQWMMGRQHKASKWANGAQVLQNSSQKVLTSSQHKVKYTRNYHSFLSNQQLKQHFLNWHLGIIRMDLPQILISTSKMALILWIITTRSRSQHKTNNNNIATSSLLN